MAKKKAFTTSFYLASIVFLPGGFLSRLINVRNLGLLIESSRKIQRIRGTPLLGRNDQGILGNTSQEFGIGIHKETIQLITIQNENRMDTILHFSTNIIRFGILSGYSILGKEKLFFSDIIHPSWEFAIRSIYNEVGVVANEQTITILVCILPEIFAINDWTMQTRNAFSWLKKQITRSISVSLMIYILTSDGYENPRSGIVCANCHLANKPVEIEVPGGTSSSIVFEAVVQFLMICKRSRFLLHRAIVTLLMDPNTRGQGRLVRRWGIRFIVEKEMPDHRLRPLNDAR
ncbi:hypothetical protein H5410_056288 [Solanum commersonii]|uniref:Cytochrome f large domain-containing protein n=1 Tax=Solanum commersonii TaxID=4109 RepID=A0A9J5WKV6_SOLCO|nr:hypothetical protein H5410_056288 [Solanum commersonii]